MKIRIGTSGWHYKHWLGVFYPERTRGAEMFEFYARHFDTVEINNSFYRLPAAKTFETWRESAPRRFLFAVKASRFTTHMKKLKDPKSSTAKFFAAAERLEKATDRLFLWSMIALAAFGVIAAGLIVMHHALDLRKHRKKGLG